MDPHFLTLVILTTATIKGTRSLECHQCNATLLAFNCLRNSSIESCSQGSESVCMSINASVTDLKGNKSNLFLRQCSSKRECYSLQPCRDIKTQMWRERPGLLVEPSCRPECCATDRCNHRVGTLDLNKSSTRKIIPTSSGRKTSKKCFEFEPKTNIQLEIGSTNGGRLMRKHKIFVLLSIFLLLTSLPF